MKKISFLLIAMAAFAATSCGSKSTTAETTDADTVATETAAPEAEVAAETPVQADVVVELAEGQTLPTADKPIVIDFNATWCGPCRNFAPTFHKVAGQFADKALFYSVDVDLHKQLAEQYQIQSIPAVIILVPGKDPVTNVGQLSEDEFTKLLNANL